MSIFSSRPSKTRVTSVVSLMRSTSSPYSIRISASASKAREYGVSLVGCLGVVR